jgi:5-methylcytosine-specific restriction protein B
MSRYHPGRDPAPTLNAARRWGECCLVAEGSIFDDQAKLWTPPLLDELDHLFVQNYDEGEGSFIQKLKGQLEPGSPQCRKLMAEALWILMLFQSNLSSQHKRETVREVWAWSGSELDDKHPMLDDEVPGDGCCPRNLRRANLTCDGRWPRDRLRYWTFCSGQRC